MAVEIDGTTTLAPSAASLTTHVDGSASRAPDATATEGASTAEAAVRVQLKSPAGNLSGASQLLLTVHQVDGALGTSMISPFVRVHIVDAISGLWREKHSTARIVYNLDTNGTPYLRRIPSAKKPWQADVGESSFIRPFATEPCILDGPMVARQLPSWEEIFLVGRPLGPDAILLFEIMDVIEERGPPRSEFDPDDENEAEESSHYVGLGWGFLDVDSMQTARAVRERPMSRRLRLQLHRYLHLPARRRVCCGAWSSAVPPEPEDAAGKPDVFAEYCPSSIPPTEPKGQGFLTRLAKLVMTKSASSVLSQRSRLPAVLEVSLRAGEQTWDLEQVETRLDSTLTSSGAALHFGSTITEGGQEGGATTDGAKVEDQSVLAKQHSRQKGERCSMPDTLLWQIEPKSRSRRGAFRLSISPSGRLLAAAVARHGGVSELRIFNLATGRLHAMGEATHDTLVYDLCWHAFTSVGAGGLNQPLLISCSGDHRVHLYEVPEEMSILERGTPVLKLHASVQLSSHVYTVRPHPALSTNPQKLVLLCGGHGFGIMLCELERIWQADDDAAGEQGGRWIALAPRMQEAPLPGVARDPDSPQRQDLLSETDHHPPADILCIRFSHQHATPDSFYASDGRGRIMMFQARFDAAVDSGRGGLRVSFVRTYTVPVQMRGVPVYSFEVVTTELLQGRRISHTQLHAADDWIVLFARDHLVRLACLQRGHLSVELELAGLESGNYPVRGVLSPDAAYVACGSESGELFLWSCTDGKRAVPAPRVQLAGPVMDVVWSAHHHLLACCALDDQAPPLLVFVGPSDETGKTSVHRPGIPDQPPAATAPLPQRQPLQLTMRSSAATEERPLSLAAAPSTSLAVADSNTWAVEWIGLGQNERSALSYERKRQMKEEILLRLLERKKVEELERHLSSARTLPGAFGANN